MVNKMRYIIEEFPEHSSLEYIVDTDVCPVGRRLDLHEIVELLNRIEELEEKAWKYDDLCK